MKNKEVSMEQIEEILSNLYNCEDVTLGVHGTAVIPENKEKNGEKYLQQRFDV